MFTVYFMVWRHSERSRPGAWPLRLTTRCFKTRLPGEPLPQASMKAGRNQPIKPAAKAIKKGGLLPVRPS
ncbi:hypothetical protein D3C71_1439770 [compost metagenome]